MICLRCGNCCIVSDVIVINPKSVREKMRISSLKDSDFMYKKGGEPCPHLSWNKEKAVCAIHHYKWYKKLRCFSHGQIERSPSDPCRTGQYLMGSITKRRKSLSYYLGSELAEKILNSVK